MVRIVLLTIFLLALAGCATNQPVESVENQGEKPLLPLVIYGEKTEIMDAHLNMTFESVPLDSVMKLMGDFAGFNVLRPNAQAPLFKRNIKLDYKDTPWVLILNGVCDKEGLFCWVKDETLYYVTYEYAEKCFSSCD